LFICNIGSFGAIAVLWTGLPVPILECLSIAL
jgi:hypothetical protein